MKLKAIFNKWKDKAIWIVVAVVAVIVLILSIYININADKIGAGLGNTLGNVVGSAVGSLNGITHGVSAGFDVGKEEGLSAKDTSTEITTKFQEVKRLQVLVASGAYTNISTMGENVDYASLYTQRYNAVFTVNLETAEVILNNGVLVVRLDQPDLDFKPEGPVTLIDDYQRHWFSGGTEDGMDMIQNSLIEIQNKTKENLSRDEGMMSTARVFAKEQLKSLINSMALNKPTVKIEFRPVVVSGVEND